MKQQKKWNDTDYAIPKFSYKFAAKTHMLACGMKAASLWFDDNIDKIYNICINKAYHSNRGGK